MQYIKLAKSPNIEEKEARDYIRLVLEQERLKVKPRLSSRYKLKI